MIDLRFYGHAAVGNVADFLAIMRRWASTVPAYRTLQSRHGAVLKINFLGSTGGRIQRRHSVFAGAFQSHILRRTVFRSVRVRITFHAKVRLALQ